MAGVASPLLERDEIESRLHRLLARKYHCDRGPAGRELFGVEFQKDFPRVGNAIGDRGIVVETVGIAKHGAGHFERFDRFRLRDHDPEIIGVWGGPE